MIDKMSMVVDGRTKVRVRYDESDNFMLPMNATKIEFLVAHDKEVADGKVTVQYELASEYPGATPEAQAAIEQAIADMRETGTGAVKVDFHPPEEGEGYIGKVESVELLGAVNQQYRPPLQYAAGSTVGGEPAVGDLTSKAKGSGARFNSGKPAHELLPLRAIGSMLMEMPESCNTQVCAVTSAVMALGLFQAQGDSPQADEHYLMEVLVATAKAAGLTVAELLDETAHVLDIARRTKYTDFNWANGMPWSVPLACASRHLIDHMLKDPRSKDEESGRLHAGHVGANVVMLLQFLHSYPEGDDRPTNL